MKHCYAIGTVVSVLGFQVQHGVVCFLHACYMTGAVSRFCGIVCSSFALAVAGSACPSLQWDVLMLS